MSKIFSVNYNKSINDKFGATATLGATATIRDDEKGKALKCNSVSTDPITYGDIASINAIGTGEFSFVVGANNKGFLNHGSVNNSLFGKATTLTSNGFGLYYQNNTSLYLHILNSSIIANINHQNKNNLYVFTRNSAGLCTFYINGILYGTPITQAGNISTTAQLSVGYEGQATTRTPNASIYLAEVYNHCLSEVEIQKLTADFQAQMPVSKPKRGLLYPKPTDLSNQKNNTLTQLFNDNFSSDTTASYATTNTSAKVWNVDGSMTVTSNGAGQMTIVKSAILSTAQPNTFLVRAKSNSMTGTMSLWTGSDYIASTETLSTEYKTFVWRKHVTSTATMTLKPTSNPTNGQDITIDEITSFTESGLVAAYNMIPNVRTLVDISGNGNSLTADFIPIATKNGVCSYGSRYYYKDVATGVTMGTGSHTHSVRVKLLSYPSVYSYFSGFGDTTSGYGSILGVDNGGRLILSCYSSPIATTTTTSIRLGVEYTISAVLQNQTVSFYVDGVFLETIALAYNVRGTKLTLFSQLAYGTSISNSELNDVRIYNRALTAQECKDYHNQFANQVVLQECFCDSSSDNLPVTPREWIPGTGVYKVQENVIPKTDLLSSLNFQSVWVTTGAPITINNANTFTSTSSGGVVQGTLVTSGKRYRCKVTGTTTATNMSVRDGNAGSIFWSPTYTGSFDSVFEFTATSTSWYFRNEGVGVTTITSISLTEIPPLPTMTNGSRYLECTTAGTIVIPSNTAYGTWEWDLYKGSDANVSAVSFINTTLNYNSVGSYLGFNGSESIYLGRTGATLLTTASSYITNNTWYRIKITRSNAGVFTVYIKGGNFTPTAGHDGWTLVSTTGGSGTNPVTDTTFTTSNYFVLDLDAGDRFANLVVRNGIVV